MSSSWFGDARAKPARESVVLQAAAAAEYAVRQGPWKLVDMRTVLQCRAANKIIEKADPEQRKHTPKHDELFNLVDDPERKAKNMAAEHPEIVARLRKLLREARESTPSLAQGTQSRHDANGGVGRASLPMSFKHYCGLARDIQLCPEHINTVVGNFSSNRWQFAVRPECFAGGRRPRTSPGKGAKRRRMPGRSVARSAPPRNGQLSYEPVRPRRLRVCRQSAAALPERGRRDGRAAQPQASTRCT